MKKDNKTIESEIIEMVYYMNGSITYEEAWNTSFENRQMIRDTIHSIKKKEAGNR